MNSQEFLQHHHLDCNPFVEEDAQTDAVFKQRGVASMYHPAWHKVLGSPTEPATSIVFGPKGSGKTAMRLQLESYIREHNRENPETRVFAIAYNDFNGPIGHLQSKLGNWKGRRPEKVLQQFGTQDHMDAILSHGVTNLVDQILQTSSSTSTADAIVRQDAVDRLAKNQRHDLLLLAACYDQSTLGNLRERWDALRKRLRVGVWRAYADWLVGWLGSIASIAVAVWLNSSSSLESRYILAIAVLGTVMSWLPYGVRTLKCYLRGWALSSNCRTRRQSIGEQAQILLQQPWSAWASDPMPYDRFSSARYELLDKFQHVLYPLGFSGVLVLVDRVDEPTLINGQPERMRLLVWPLLDNKLLKHPGLGFKMMLPQELQYFIDRESREFHERARLDKQNVISGFSWSGEALYDLVSSRLAACNSDGQAPDPVDLFESNIDRNRLINAMRDLQTPRRLFRFLFQLLSEHCKKHINREPIYKIQSATFESVLASSLDESRRQGQ